MFGSPETVGRPSESASVGPPGPFGSNRVCICGQGATKRRNSQEATPEQGGRSWERRLVQAEPSQSFSPPPWPSWAFPSSGRRLPRKTPSRSSFPSRGTSVPGAASGKAWTSSTHPDRTSPSPSGISATAGTPATRTRRRKLGAASFTSSSPRSRSSPGTTIRGTRSPGKETSTNSSPTAPSTSRPPSMASTGSNTPSISRGTIPWRGSS